MATCTQCSSELPAGSRFCPACGAMQSSVSQMPTAVATPTPPPVAPGSVTTPVGRLDSSAGSAGASFQAGQVLNGRYRVIGLLGRGGMGEVYRADDLELAQPVSLKFLGRGFGERPGMLDRFRDEVRNARQVSHPNICRVHDIGEAEGQYFLSMEYVDGEDLGMLLRRIGRLPRAKADQVARQLCAGLAAAHERGVIHRDLKPSNVMLDGEGRVRITDFGLAVRGEGAGAGDVAGTPAYMAPEQFEGRAATPQTDLYSLGLILYEIYTGRRPLDATTWDGWKSQHSQVEPRSPLELERDVEEPVARAILRCLEKDPARRPSSALSLAASLPGGDPLAAALAAGETPSPEMVAASGGEGSLSPRAAWSLLAVVVAVVGVVLAIAPQSSDLGLAPMSRSPVVLESRARDIATALGYSATPRDRAWWLERDYDPMKWRARREPSTRWRANYSELGPPVRLHYRQSPRPMEPRSGFAVGADDPPISVTGMVSVSVDSRGRLQSFLAVPPQLDSSAALAVAPPVGALFEYAGLDSARFTEVPPAWVPLPAFDRRREWVGNADWLEGAPLRVTAAWWRDRPVAFQVRGPWVRPQRQETAPRVRRNEFAQVGITILFVVVILFGAFSVRRRLGDGRSDWRGGLRLVTFMLLCRALLWVVGAHHTLELGDEFGSFGLMMGVGLMESLFLFSVYLAVEPFVRRHTPELLVGWARVLQGRPGDARVGRDVLVGALFGVLGTLTVSIVNALPSWLPFAGQTPVPPHMDALAGGLRLAAAYFALPSATLMPGFIVFGSWFLLRLVLRRPLLAAVALALVIAGLSLGAENPTLEVPGALVRGTLLAWVITRHGLLALVSFSVVVSLFTIVPLPIHMDAPYAVQSLVGLALVLALVAWAFRVSLGGRPAFSLAAGD